MSFMDIARPFTDLGMKVFPLKQRGKEPVSGIAFLDAATTDPAKIAEWSREYPESNVAILADDHFCFLEFDIADGMSAAADEMGEDQPTTREQKSGRGFGHFIFKHTERSRAIGNRSVNLSSPCYCYKAGERPSQCTRRTCPGATHHHHEWFSFRSHNKYLVGAGSTHPCGNRYETVFDVEPSPVPEWVCDFIEKHSLPASASKCVDSLSVAEDFDFEDLMEFYGIGGRWKGDWYITDECPIAGRRHHNSTMTGFFHDGNSFGFHCFAQGCEGSCMSAGRVIAELNSRQGKPYPHAIWDSEDEDDDSATSWVDTDSVDIAEDPESEAEVALEHHVETPKGRILTAEELMVLLDAVPYVMPLPEPSPKQEPSYVESLEELIREQKATGELPMTEADFASPQPDVNDVKTTVDSSGLGMDFPGDSAMYGRLGEIARQNSHLPFGWFYPSLMAVASALPIETSSPVRSNIYVANLAPIGSGKTVCQEAALKSIYIPCGETVIAKDAPGSHSGLLNQLYDDEPKPLLLFPDELSPVLNSCAIEGSNLTSMLCSLWNRDEVGSSVKKGRQLGYGKLSILGGVPVTDSAGFGKIFGASTVGGLYDRFIFGYAGERIKFKPTSVKPLSIDVRPVNFRDWVWDALHQWQESDTETRGRLGENALRIALITASCNGDNEVTKECFEAALRLMEWQERLRAVFKPGLAETKESEAFEAVFAALKEVYDTQKANRVPPKGTEKLSTPPAEKDRWMLINFRNVINSKSYYRSYSGLIDRVRKALIRDDFIEEFKDEVEFDGKVKKVRTPFVILKALVR